MNVLLLLLAATTTAMKVAAAVGDSAAVVSSDIHTKPALVPEDEHTQINATVTVSSGVGNCASCLCGTGTLDLQAVAPIGW